jgi:hypothetical protein
MSKLSVFAVFIASLIISFTAGTNVLLAQSANSKALDKKIQSSPVAQTNQTPIPTQRPVVKGVVVSPSPSALLTPTPIPVEAGSLTDITKTGPLEELINSQQMGPFWASPIKHAIRDSMKAGVPANTIVLLLLLPLVAAVIAATRHLIGIRGFGIFLPASLSVVFVATGPIVGLGLFILITLVSVLFRLFLRKTKLRLQYLPRMAFLLWAVSISVLGVLFLAPLINYSDITSVSIFPVLLLALLAEDFSRVQLGKSFKTAINLTSETLILALVSYLVLTFAPIQKFAILNPEVLLITIAIFNFLVGRYSGLRFMEFWRFRKLISG